MLKPPSILATPRNRYLEKRRLRFKVLGLIALGLFLGAVLLIFVEVVKAQPLPLGTILVSRNSDETENTSPGYWNHAAIYVGKGCVIESQAGQGVIKTVWHEYWARPYSEIVCVMPRNPVAGAKACERVKELVGRPFAPYSSLVGLDGLRHRRGLNCMSVVEIGYSIRFINRPDRIFNKAAFERGRYLRNKSIQSCPN